MILAVLACFPGCRKTRGAESSVFLLADLLRAENVIRSPLAGLAAGQLGPSRYPVESYPPAGLDENPLGIVRKHTAGNVEARVLFAPAGSEYQFDLTLPENPVLSFAVEVVRDLNSVAAMAAANGDASGVEFIIRLEAGRRHRVVFQKHLNLPEARESRTLNYSAHRLDLPGGGTRVRLRFITGGSKGAHALWYSPVLYGRGQTRPNVVLVSVDTLRADHVGAYGYGRDTTPHLDALAAESALFKNVFAPSSWTLPSHVSMLTGLDGRRHGVYYESDRMNPGHPTLASYLRDKGYVSVGITGGAFVAPFYGFSRGFDSYTIGHGELADSELAAKAAAEATAWLEANAEVPFFLFLHTYQVHHPYLSPEAYARRYAGPKAKRLEWDFKTDHGGWASLFRPLPAEERQNIIDLYDGEIRYTDDALLGPLLDKLRSLGLYDRTLILVTS
ncbi:MAG: sulfatase, partial [Candidatus Aminicenantes bacterium]|nr:sulfatase [Candidatus Aminicenantes bacterium]